MMYYYYCAEEDRMKPACERWFPIDSCPKNGKNVLLYIEKKGYEGSICVGKYTIYPMKCFYKKKFYTPQGEAIERNGVKATKWMPLPLPPRKGDD